MVGLTTCSEDPVGPGGNGASIRLRPVLPPYARVAPLVVDHVAIFVFRFIPPESSEQVYSDTVAFNVNRNTLSLNNVRIAMDHPTEEVQVEIELLAGNTILFSGISSSVTLVRGATVENVDVPLSYSGPGSNLTSLQISPRDTFLQRGATMDFELDGFDIQGAEVPQYYAGWSLSAGAANSAKINAVGHLTASSVNDTFFVVVATPNGVLDSARVIVSSSTTTPTTTLVWTGAASTDFSAAGNWSPAQVPSFGDSAVIGSAASQRQPSLSTTTVVAALSIIDGGNLTIAGKGISVIRGLTTGGTGVVTMTNPADIVAVQGDALFDGGDELDLMSDGALSVGGNLTQRATNSGDSFHPSGNHVTLLSGSNPTLSFATPGLVAGTSHFQSVGWIGTGTLTLATQVLAHDEMVVTTQGGSIIRSTNGSRLTVGNLTSIGALVLDNVPLTLQQATTNSLDLSNITFQNMATNVSQLVVSHPGGQFTFDNIRFSTTPVGPNGFYIDATDINSQTDGFLIIDMTNPTPASGGAFVKASGGAVVNWPAGATAVRTWSGATSTAWETATNWVGGVVPGPSDSAVIIGATNSPSVGSSVTVGAVNVASGTLTIGDASLSVARGFSTTGSGTLAMQSGAGLDVGGSVSFGGGSTAGLLDNGTVTVAGNFTQTSGSSTQSFAAGPNNRVILDNLRATVVFSSSGLTASHFGILQEGNTSSGFTFNSDVALSGTLEGPDGFTGDIIGSNVSLTMVNGFGCCVGLDGVRLIIDDPTGQGSGISGVTFTNLPSTATQLTLRHPGFASTAYSLSSITWQPLSAGNTGSYLDATDVNGATGGTLAVNIIGSDPGNGPTFTKTSGGTLVFWPASTIQWTGATSTDWFTPSNWNALRLPFDQPVLIPAGTPNAPSISNIASASAGNLTVAAGQTLAIQTGGALNAKGNVSAPGAITTAGTGVINLTGVTGTLSGNVGNLNVQGGYTLGGGVTLAPGGGSLVISSGSITLAGHSLATGSLTTNTTASLLVMTNVLDSVIISGAANIGGADETGHLTAGVMVVGGDFIVSPFTALGMVASGTHKVVLNGTVNQQIQFPTPAGSVFQDLTVNVTGGAVVRPIGGTTVVKGNLLVSSGKLALNNRRIDVGGNFSITGTSWLSMRNPIDSLTIAGSALFAGGTNDTMLTSGVLKVTGDFTQSAVNSVLSFAPSGLHKTVLGGAAASDVSMGSPGTGGNGSHFQVLDVTPATGGVILDVNMAADSLISTAVAARIESPLVALTARRVQVTGATFFNTRFVLDEQGTTAPENFSGVTFSGFSGGSNVLLTVIGLGASLAPRPAVTTANITFQTLAVGAANFYVDLTSSNGLPFVMTMTGSNQGTAAGGNGPALTRVTPGTGAAIVNWP